MIHRLLFVHLCLLAIAAVDVCPGTPPPPNKSMPVNTAGQLHITQATSPDASYNPHYVLEVTDFDLDTPIKSFAQYAGPAITSKAACEKHSVFQTHWYFDQETGCWEAFVQFSKAGVWKSGNYCELYVEQKFPTKNAFGTPIHYTKVRVEVAAFHKTWWHGQILYMKKKVKAGVISF